MTYDEIALASRAYRTRAALEAARPAMAEARTQLEKHYGEHPHAIALDLLRQAAAKTRLELKVELQTIRLGRPYAEMKNKGRTYREAVEDARALIVGLNQLRKSIRALKEAETERL